MAIEDVPEKIKLWKTHWKVLVLSDIKMELTEIDLKTNSILKNKNLSFPQQLVLVKLISDDPYPFPNP